MDIKKFLKPNLLILYIVVILGAVLRLQGVFTKSFAFTYDVGRDMLALRDIANLSHIPFIGPTTGIPGVFYGPWWYYLLTPFFLIFRGDPQGIAFVMALIGVATIILGYIFGNKIGGKFLGISFAALISISPAMISLSAQIWNPNIAPLFTILTLIVIERILNGKKNTLLNYLFLGLLLSLSLDIELFYGSMLFAGSIISLLLIDRKKYTVREVLVFLFGILIILSPRILFEIKNHFLMVKSLLFFLSSGQHKMGIADLIPQRFNIFLSHFSDTIFQSNTIVGLIIIVVLIFTLAIFYKKIDKTEAKFLELSIITLCIFFLGTVFFSHDIWPHYLVGLPVFYLLILSIGLDSIFKKGIKVPAILLLIIVIFYNFNPIVFYENLYKPLWEGDAAVYRNQLSVVDYVYAQANGEKFKYVVYTPTVNDYSYKYLFYWYGPVKYRYEASNRADTAYFILEPDFQDPSRLTDWLHKRSLDGKIIKSKVVRGGVIVQTRDVK